MNGAAMIHDLELGLFGETSQDVEAAVQAGSFGNPKLGRVLQEAARLTGDYREDCEPLGEKLRIYLACSVVPYAEHSLLALESHHVSPLYLESTTTVHLAVGADTIWNDIPPDEATALAHRSVYDFAAIRNTILSMSGKPAVWLNIGSAQFLPEVFLKASAWAIKEGADLTQLTKANLDFIRAYRTGVNILSRGPGKQSIELTGHHEIMLPLLWASILSLDKKDLVDKPYLTVTDNKAAELYFGWR